MTRDCREFRIFSLEIPTGQNHEMQVTGDGRRKHPEATRDRHNRRARNVDVQRPAHSGRFEHHTDIVVRIAHRSTGPTKRYSNGIKRFRVADDELPRLQSPRARVRFVRRYSGRLPRLHVPRKRYLVVRGDGPAGIPSAVTIANASSRRTETTVGFRLFARGSPSFRSVFRQSRRRPSSPPSFSRLSCLLCLPSLFDARRQ